MTYSEIKELRFNWTSDMKEEEVRNALYRKVIDEKTKMKFVCSILFHSFLVLVNYAGWLFFVNTALSVFSLPFFALLCLIPIVGYGLGRLVSYVINFSVKNMFPYWTYNILCGVVYANIGIVLIANCIAYHFLVESVL